MYAPRAVASNGCRAPGFELKCLFIGRHSLPGAALFVFRWHTGVARQFMVTRNQLRFAFFP